MKKFDKQLHIILIVIGSFLLLSERFFYLDFLSKFYRHGDTLLIIGVVFLARGYYIKKKTSKKNESE